MGLSSELTEHLLHPRGVGDLEGEPPAGVGRGENIACGDVLVVWVRYGPGGLELTWRGQACGAVLAVASLAAEALTGCWPAEVAAFDLAAHVEAAGGLERRSRHAVPVFERALAEAMASRPEA